MKKYLLALLAGVLCVGAFAQTTTTYVGLTLPNYATSNWNVPLNKNFTLIDSAIGGVQVPYQGVWSSTTTYQRGQQVTYESGLYVSLINSNLANTPTNATAWLQVPSSFTGGTITSALTGPVINNVVNACAYTGSDIGAKIQAADTAWSGTAVELDVNQSCGTTQSTTFVLSANHTLKFTQGGTYTMLQGNVVRSNTTVTAVGPQVILQLASNQTGGMFQLTDSTASASNATFSNFTMDGNQANAPSTCSTSTYQCAYGFFINSSTSSAPDHVRIHDIAFQNFWGFPIWIYPGGTGYSYANWVWIEHNTFTNTKKEAIRSYAFGAHMVIKDNTFSDYGNLDLTNYDAIYFADVLATTCSTTSVTQDWDIEGNRFYNTNGNTKFATELFGGTMLCSLTDGLVYRNNFHDGGNYSGGTGLSAGSLHAIITNNVWLNGGANTDRNGIESWTSHSVIANNTIDGGAIQVYPSGTTNSTVTDVTISGNSIKNSTDAGSGVNPIWLTTGSGASGSSTTNVTIVGNDIDMSGSACTSNDTDIMLMATTTMAHIAVRANNLLLCNGAGASAVRLSTNSGESMSNVVISGNSIKGSGTSTASGILDTSTDTRDSDIHIQQNHFINVITPLNLSLPATQWDEWGNDYSSTPGPFNAKNGFQAGGLTVVSSTGDVRTMTTSTWSPFYYASNFSSSSYMSAFLTPTAAAIVSAINYSVTVAPVGCTTQPLIKLHDLTLGSDVAGSTVNITALYGTSGSLSLALTSGHEYEAYVVGGVGCTTNISYPQATVIVKNTSSVSVRTAFVNGSSTASFGNFIGSGETLTQIEVTAQQAPAGCSTSPTMALYDYTSSSTVSGTTVSLSASYNNSGTISATLTNGDDYGWVFTAGSGCTTALAHPGVTAQYTSGYQSWSSELYGSITNATTYYAGSFTPASNLLISTLSVSAQTAAAGCTSYPTIQLYDATNSAVVSNTLATMTTASELWTTGLAGSLLAGHTYEYQVTGGTGCSTAPASLYITSRYMTNDGNLKASNNLADVQSASAARTALGINIPTLGAPGYLRWLGTGADGALSVTSGTTNLSGEKWYTSVSISAGAIVADTNNSQPLVIRSTGVCTIAGTISVSVNTGSGAGGSSSTSQGGGTGGGGGGGTAAGTAGSNNQVASGGTAGAASGGAGGNGNTNSSVYFRTTATTGLSIPAYWPYGGAHGGAGGSSGPAGGVGGSALVLVCQSINFTGTIDASGGAGSASTANSIGASGGGGGGDVLMSAQTWTANTGTINVAGGAGGSCGSYTTCGAGGTGGAGNSLQFTIQ